VVTEQWDENEEREAYTDYERALKLRQMIDVLGLNQTEIAERIGKTQGWVAQQLRILRLEGIITPVILEKMTEYQARAILAAPEEDRMALVSYIELFFEEREAILSASAIRDYSGDLTRLRELEKNRGFHYELEEAGYPVEPADASVAPEVIRVTSDESIQHLDEEIDRRELLPFDDKRPLLKETPTVDGRVVAFINQNVGTPAEDLQMKIIEEHGLCEEEAQAALQAYREVYPDIWARGYPEEVGEKEDELTVDQYVDDVLTHNPEVKVEELVKATVELYSVPEAFAQGIIDNQGQRRGRKRSDPYAMRSPRILCPLCGRQNAEINKLRMVLDATPPEFTLVKWLREVLT